MSLLDLAKKKFAFRELTAAEVELFTKVEAGEVASTLKAEPKQNDPANAAEWPTDRILNAECLEWLCTDRKASRFVKHEGITIKGMQVAGPLDLQFAHLSFPLRTSNCAFLGAIMLNGAQLSALYFEFTHVKTVSADSLEVDGDLYLQYVTSTGEISIVGSAVGGSVVCTGAHFKNPGGICISGSRLKVNGSVFLSDGFKADGEINLVGATIGGQLVCKGGQFSNPEKEILIADGRKTTIGGTALSANGAKVGASVFLNNGFQSKGQVNFGYAIIGQTLDCTSAEFVGQQSPPSNNAMVQKVAIAALIANGANIDGTVFFRSVTVTGELNIVRAKIGGHLECDGSKLTNAHGNALNADSVQVRGSVFLRGNFKALGRVNLITASIAGALDCSTADLTGPEYDVAGPNGSVEKHYQTALMANGVNVEGGVFLTDGFRSAGEVNFLGAKMGSNLECMGAKLTQLVAERTTIGGNVYLSLGFKADGIVDFLASDISSYFVWLNVDITSATSLDLRSARVGTLYDDTNWPTYGNLFLDGFNYQRIHDASPTDAKRRIDWLGRQATEPFFPQPYEQLALVLRNTGHEGRAREILVEKNLAYGRSIVRELRQKQWWQRLCGRLFKQEWWWHNVFGQLNGYGYKPWRAFFLSVVVILFGWGLFHYGYTRDLISPERENAFRKNAFGHVVAGKGIAQKHRVSKNYPKFNAFVYSLESFTPLLKLDQSSNWTPNANNGRIFFVWHLHATAGTLLRTYLWFHIIAGWVLTSLWVGGLTGLVKT